MKNIIRTIIGLALLLLGIFIGTSWQYRQSTPVAQTTIEKTDTEQTNGILDNDADAIPAQNADSRFTPQERATIDLFERSAPSVVFITTSNVRRDYWTRNITEIPRGTGSGFVWDNKGHIITNYHVIQGADRATVTFSDQKVYPASLVGAAPEKDLAVLKIEVDDARELHPIPVGDSDGLRVGQNVYAIGNPFGLDQSLTTGIISALGREIESVGKVPIQDVIQTDAAINPGNSGGPLLDSQGHLIGVNTAIYSPSGAYAGVGFSIPSHVLGWVVPDLIQFGKINRPTLGVELASKQVMSRMGMKGILILDVIPGSPADQVGLRPTMRLRNGSISLGDVITAIDGEPVNSRADLILLLENYKVGDQVKVALIRDYEAYVVELVLAGET